MIQLIGHVDTWAISSWLFRNRAVLKGEDGHRLLMVQEDGKLNDELAKVPSFKVLLQRAERLIRPTGYEIALAVVEQLDGKTHLPWRISDGPLEVHVGIVTNPGNLLYSGGHQWMVLPGQVVAIDTNVMHSSVNFGDRARLHLVLQLEKASEARDD